MKLKDLIDHWAEPPGRQLTVRKYSARLPVWDAARIAALAQLFPSRTKTQIITDLLSAALDEFESSLPYVRGDRVVSEDDHGDPIYEDAGLTPPFMELARRYADELARESGMPAPPV